MAMFPPISECKLETKSYKTIATDLDGTLLISNSAFPYYMLVAIEAGSVLRGFILLLSLPFIGMSYFLISESLAIQTLIYVSFKGLNLRDIDHVARTVLPRFYGDNVRRESFDVFDTCRSKKVVVTASPVIMVEPFVKDYLGGDKVLGTQIEVDLKTGKATGFVTGDGVLVSGKKRAAIEAEFGKDGMPDVGLGDRKSDHDFMAICKEGYMVPEDKKAKPVAQDRLKSPIIFNEGRVVHRPDPLNALIFFICLPFTFLLSLFKSKRSEPRQLSANLMH